MKRHVFAALWQAVEAADDDPQGFSPRLATDAVIAAVSKYIAACPTDELVELLEGRVRLCPDARFAGWYLTDPQEGVVT